MITRGAKKTFLVEMSAKAYSPPPLVGLNGQMNKNLSFFNVYKETFVKLKI